MSRRHEFPFQIMSASIIRDRPQHPHITISNAHKILSNTTIFIPNDAGCCIVGENYSIQQSYKHSCCHSFKEHSVFPQVLITDTVAVAETSVIHRIYTQICQRTHPAHLPVLFRGPTFCTFHHVVERRVLRHCDVNVELRCHVRSDPQGVRYRYLYSTGTTISVLQNILRVRGGRNCQNDEVKEKKPHAGICRRLSEFEGLTVTGSASGATLNTRGYFASSLSMRNHVFITIS